MAQFRAGAPDWGPPYNQDGYTRLPTKDVVFESFTALPSSYDNFRMRPDSLQTWEALAQHGQRGFSRQAPAEQMPLPATAGANGNSAKDAKEPDLEKAKEPEPEKVLTKEEEAEAFKLDEKKNKMRAQTFDNYSLVSALIFGFACSAIKWSYGDYLSNLAFRNEEPDLLSTCLVLLYFSHVAVMALIAALTMYSTMVFVLSGVYTRTGVAMGNLKGLNTFIAELAPQRDRAFKSFIAASIALPCDLILQAFACLVTYGFRQNPIIFVMLLPAIFVATMSSIKIFELLRIAGKHLFGVKDPEPPKPPPETERTDRSDTSIASTARPARKFGCCL